jgi:hypothetical protein
MAQDNEAPKPDIYLQLNRKIFARHEDQDSEKMHVSQDEKVSQIRAQLHDLTTQAVSVALQGATPSAKDVTGAVSSLHGEMSFASMTLSRQTNTPFADLFKLNGIESLAVGYVIMQGGEFLPDTQPYLEFWDKSNGVWTIRAEAPTRSDFRGHDFFISKLDSGTPGEVWFLAWGQIIGNTGAAVDVRLYAFDGAAVRTVWKRDYLSLGEVTVSNSSVILEYDRVYKSRDLNNRVRETLHVTPNGLQ